MTTYTFPYDPTGLALSNIIESELHSVQPPDDIQDASFIVPRAAPFFKDGLEVRTTNPTTGPILVEGVDFVLGHKFIEAIEALGKPIYGSIILLNRQYTGNVYVTYNTLGGAYTLDDYRIVETITRRYHDVFFVSWTEIDGLPVAFPPATHPVDGEDLTGLAEVVQAIEDIALAITNKPPATSVPPHNHTPAQVGLGSVQNFPPATALEVENATPGRYITPDTLPVAYPQLVEGISIVPEGLTGNGLPADPLALDGDWLDIHYTPSGLIPVSRAGDVSDSYLPIDAGYYSIKYPRGVEQPLGTAFIEGDGRLTLLSPTTNGTETRLVYSYIKNFVSGSRTVTPTNIVYEPPGLPAGTYIRACFPTSKTAFIVEIWDSATETFSQHAVIEVNGSFNAEDHRVILLGEQLITLVAAHRGVAPNTLNRQTIKLGSPVVATFSQTEGIVFIGIHLTTDILPLRLNLTTGILTNGFTCNAVRSPTYTKTGNAIQFYTVDSSGTDDKAAIYISQNYDDWIFTQSTVTGNWALSIGQDGNKVSLRAAKAYTIRHATAGVTARSVSYSFNVGYDLTALTVLATLDSQFQSSPAQAYTASPGLPPVYPIYEDWAINGGLSYASNCTILDNGCEVRYRGEPFISAPGTITLRQPTTPQSVTSYVATNKAVLNMTTMGTSLDLNVYLPLPTAVEFGDVASFINRDHMYGWGDRSTTFERTAAPQTGWIARVDPRDTEPTIVNGYSERPGAKLNNDRVLVPAGETFERVSYAGEAFDHPMFVGDTVFYGGHNINHDPQVKHRQYDTDGQTLTKSGALTLTTAGHQSFDDAFLEHAVVLSGVSAPTYFWGLYYVPEVQHALGFVHVINSTGSARAQWMVFSLDQSPTELTGFVESAVLGSPIIVAGDVPVVGITSKRLRPVNTSLAILKRDVPGAPSFDLIARLAIQSTLVGSSPTGSLYRFNFTVGSPWEILTGTYDGPNSQCFTATAHPDLGLGVIGGDTGFGAVYSFRPWDRVRSVGGLPVDDDMFPLVSPKPATTFRVTITREFPVYMLGRQFVIEPMSIDLYEVDPAPANSTFFVYIYLEAGFAKLMITRTSFPDTRLRIYVGQLITDANGVISDPFRTVSRFDSYRPSLTGQGSSFPISLGKASNGATLDPSWIEAAGGGGGGPVDPGNPVPPPVQSFSFAQSQSLNGATPTTLNVLLKTVTVTSSEAIVIGGQVGVAPSVEGIMDGVVGKLLLRGTKADGTGDIVHAYGEEHDLDLFVNSGTSDGDNLTTTKTISFNLETVSRPATPDGNGTYSLFLVLTTGVGEANFSDRSGAIRVSALGQYSLFDF